MTGVASLTQGRPRHTVKGVPTKHMSHTSHNSEEDR